MDAKFLAMLLAILTTIVILIQSFAPGGLVKEFHPVSDGDRMTAE